MEHGAWSREYSMEQGDVQSSRFKVQGSKFKVQGSEKRGF
jgi:hypothetical protein